MDTRVKLVFLNFKIYLALWSKNLKFKKFKNSFKKYNKSLKLGGKIRQLFMIDHSKEKYL